MNKIQAYAVVLFLLFGSNSFCQNTIDMNLISINEAGDSKPGSFTAAISGFYFKVDPPFSKQDIYFTDGTDIGTQLVYDNPNNDDIYIVGSLGDNLFFSIDTAFDEETLFYYNKTLDSTTQLAVYSSNFTSSAFSRYILDFKVFNGIAYYSAYNTQTGYELHQSDGTVAGTFLTMDINTSSSTRGSFPRNFTPLNGNMLFTADGLSTTQSTNLSSIWRITSNGTVEKITNTVSDDMSSAQIINNELYYLSYSQNTAQSDIYKTDGTLFNESVVLNYSSSPNQFIFKLMGNVNDELLFVSKKANNDINLEKLNTTTFSTSLLRTLETSNSTFLSPSDLLSIQLPNKIVFIYGVGFTNLDANLFTTDGTVTGSYFLNNTTNIQPTMRPRILHKTANDHIIFSAGNPSFYHLNPNTDQINITDKIYGGGNSGTENEFILFNSITYLIADDGLSGFELFSYDEIQDVATKIVDLKNEASFTSNPSNPGYPVNSVIPFKQGFIAFGSNGANSNFPNLSKNIYFYDSTNQSMNSLYEGTLSFLTNFLEQIPLISNNNYTIFAANDDLGGFEPWITDGTETGTFKLLNINLNGSSLDEFTVFRKAGNHFFFDADDGTQSKIYLTDGTTQGTTIFNPLNETVDYTLNNVVFSNNKYYFGYTTITNNSILANNKVVVTDNNFNLIETFNLSNFVSYFHVFNDTIITVEPDSSSNYWNHDIYFQTNSTNRQFVGRFFSPYTSFTDTFRFPRIRNTLELNNNFYFIIGDRHIISTDGTIAGTSRTPTLIGGSLNHLFSINNRIFATDEYLPNTTGKSANIVEINIGGNASDPFSSMPSQNSLTSYRYNNSHIIRLNPWNSNDQITMYDVINDTFYATDYNIISNTFPFTTDLRLGFTLDAIFNDDQILALGRTNDHGLELYSGSFDFSTLNLIDQSLSSIQNDSPIVYPNPVSNLLYINTNNMDIKTVVLYDLTGKKIEISSRLDIANKSVNLTNIQKGIYILNVELINQTNHSIKVIKN